jgi:IS5 family transposase
MIRTRHYQPSLWTGILTEEVDDLWEPWMRTADRLLDDQQLIDRVFEAQARRWLKSRTRGRQQTPSEVVLRLLILKHVRDWSYEVLEREVRAQSGVPDLRASRREGSGRQDIWTARGCGIGCDCGFASNPG